MPHKLECPLLINKKKKSPHGILHLVMHSQLSVSQLGLSSP